MNCMPIPEIAPTKFKRVANFGIAKARINIIIVDINLGR